jgi:NAD(P)-dependent dehydrogenase (short-subunit alcohol dehydrogenase family)
MDVIEDLFGVAGKCVLVTGGGRGIGRAIAEAFVKAGARVYICSRRAEVCTRTAEELAAFGSCVALTCDVAIAEDRRRLVQQVADREKALNVLVNNAGALWAAPLTEYPESGWDKVFNLNVKGTFFLIRELVPLLAAGGTPDNPARIINLGSIDGFHIPRHETYAYTSSKAALHHLTRHLASQLAAQNITANVIAPGMFPSNMLAPALDRQGLEATVAPVPLKRLTSESDMAGAAIFLASKAGSYLTGAVLPVDGGYATTL